MSKLPYIFLGVVSVILISVLDYLITIDISLSICYLVPIFIATRYINKSVGILLSISSAVSWFIAENTAKAHLNFPLLFWNTIVRLSVFLIIVHLLDALKTAYEKEKKLARIDGLTQIYNRRYFLDILRIESKRAIRYDRCLTLAYFDVDNFKLINDRYGHNRGDELLSLIGCTIEQSTRDTDIVARLGGDEFALLLPETNYQAAQLVLQRIHQKLIRATKDKSFDVGFSMGAVTFMELPTSVSDMLDRVDKIMYQVKAKGKNQLQHQLN